jgi:uridine kinase
VNRVVDAAQATAVVAGIEAERAGATTFVGIDGPGAAGKSTLARHIAAGVPGAVVLAVDDFAGPDVAEWDWGRFTDQVLQPLRQGRTAHYQRWDWDSNRGAEWQDIAPGSLIVVEGVSSTRREVAVTWALRIWVDTPRELRLARALERDGPARLQRWTQDWIPSEEAYFAVQDPRARADLVVRGDR